ncbi:MAG: helix-turn-helix domain-containing protein [Oscillospiraceae bacterium]|nr:helix-turn-helix domain-containing protein [Oscillospiraceae bacterium]
MGDPLLHETKIHGTLDFPYIVYHGKIPEYIQSFPRHWHDEAELIYAVSGQLRVCVWSESFHISAGDIVIVLPHAIHSIEQVGSESAEYYNIVFDFSIFGKDACYEKYVRPFLQQEKTVNCCERKGSELNEQLKPLVLSLIEHRQYSYSTHEYLVKSNLFMIMHLLNRHCVDAKENELALHQTYDKLKMALYWVQLSYAQDIPVKKAASLCGFSESHFMKLFKELTGMSFTAYLIGYRLELAANQLIETDLNIIEIAANCGFHNHSYFTRAFVKKYGVTPIQYRNGRRGS